MFENTATNEMRSVEFLEIEDLEDRVELDVHGACACTTSCKCSSCSCVVWW